MINDKFWGCRGTECVTYIYIPSVAFLVEDTRLEPINIISINS